MARVFQRSLVAHGLRGMSISLPRAWLDGHGLKPRDKVEVIVKDELIIRAVPNRDSPTLLRSLVLGSSKGVRVTLPIWWLRFYGLKPGDRVQVIDNGDLIVRPLSKESQSKAD